MRDLVDSPSLQSAEVLRPHGGPRAGGSPTAVGAHMAHTDYEVLSVSEAAPRRSCLMIVQPVTGQFTWCDYSADYCTVLALGNDRHARMSTLYQLYANRENISDKMCETINDAKLLCRLQAPVKSPSGRWSTVSRSW